MRNINGEIKILNLGALLDIIYNKETADYKLNLQENGAFEKFKYFAVNTIHCNEGDYFLVKFNESSEIIGIMNIKIYIDSDKPSKPIDYVSYIDIREDYKNKGIATEMIKVLSLFYSNKKIAGTSLSIEGRKCKINNVFKKYIKDNWFDDIDDYLLA